MSTKRKKSWQEKLTDTKGLPKVIVLEGKMATRFGAGTMVVPAPFDVDAVMKTVPKGKITTMAHIRKALAARYGTTSICPITTGIFAWIAAHAAAESTAAGAKRVTPWWRTLKGSGELNPKYPGGTEAQAALLESEGISVLPGKGKKPPVVANFEKVVYCP